MKKKEGDAHTHTQTSSKLKPQSQTKSKGTQSKTDKKKALVAYRLSMLEEETDPLKDLSCVKQEHSTPMPTSQPLEVTRPSITKGSVQQSRDKSSYCNSSAMKRAEELQASLSDKHPSLVKYMLHSHIASGFWLGLAKKFCDKHLPKSDTDMELIDENGEISYAKYLAAKVGLSAGWRGFSIAHNLKEGDVVVFELVKKISFKVYIIRKDGLGETDGALELLNLDTNLKLTSNDFSGDDGDKDGECHSDNSPSNESHGSEVLDWIRLSEPDESVNLESFEKFSILLDGSVSIDAKFPDHIRRKYYNLCTSQNSCLHEKLLKGLNCTLVVGIINETINISDAIAADNCSTQVSESDLMTYEKTLQSFEVVGMNVGSIRSQIHRILRGVIEQEEIMMEVMKVETEIAGERMKNSEMKFLELKKNMQELDGELEMMNDNTKKKRLMLKQMENSSFCD